MSAAEAPTFKRFVEVGRVVLVNDGPSKGKLAAIVEIKNELESLAKNKPEQFKIVHVLEKPERSWKGLKGFVDHDALAKNLPLPGLADKTKIFVCGPPPMVEVVCGNKPSPKDQGPLKGYLADLGYQPSQIYKF